MLGQQFVTAAAIAASVLFILSLGGLSNQEKAKRAVWYGIAGMALAVAATLIGPGSGLWLMSVALIAGGGIIGFIVAKRVQMTEMPQLVAAMHSLVGLAAVFVGYNAHIELGRVSLAELTNPVPPHDGARMQGVSILVRNNARRMHGV